jgi:hypothetical protein
MRIAPAELGGKTIHRSTMIDNCREARFDGFATADLVV